MLNNVASYLTNATMQHLTITFPDREDLSLLIEDALRKILPDIAKHSASSNVDQVEYLTRADVVKKYKISLVTLHNHTKLGLPSIKIGKRRLYQAEIIERHFGNKRQA